MIFALFFIILFVGIMSFVQFGPQLQTAATPAQLYAENMSIWHQAAMLAVKQDPTLLHVCTSVPSNQGCGNEINDHIWDLTTNTKRGELARVWPEYTPMVPISTFSGWHSYYLLNVNGLTGDFNNQTEAYVLTVFRGFGGRSQTNTVGAEKGQTDEANFIQSLSKTVTERSGLGILRCNGTLCYFTRLATEQVPGSSAITDEALRFDTRLFLTGQRSDFPNHPAIMTRVSNTAN